MAEEREGEREATPNPRAFWSGTLTFGLVSVPVDLFPAVRSRRIGLRTLGPEQQPLVRRYFCSTRSISTCGGQRRISLNLCIQSPVSLGVSSPRSRNSSN